MGTAKINDGSVIKDPELGVGVAVAVGDGVDDVAGLGSVAGLGVGELVGVGEEDGAGEDDGLGDGDAAAETTSLGGFMPSRLETFTCELDGSTTAKEYVPDPLNIDVTSIAAHWFLYTGPEVA